MFSPAFMGENQTYFFEFGEYRLDRVERRLLRNGKVVALTPKAFETLCLLVENCGHLLEKDRLMEMLWADAFVEEGNLADNVSKIRQALGDSRKEPKFIETVSGRGYRFVAEVRRIEADTETQRHGDAEMSEPSATAGGLNAAELNISDFKFQTEKQSEIGHLKSEINEQQRTKDEGQSNQDQKPTENRKTNSHWVAGLSVLVLFALGVTGFFIWRGIGESSGGPIKSVAILPFKPLVSGNRDEALELGMSDTLISGLSRLRSITVRPISAVRKYTDLEQDALAAGRELGVESVLDGNIQRTDERIRISARLVRVEDGTTLWSETFDEKFTNIFDVQDSIAERIIGALALQLSGDERNDLVKKYTANTQAYHLYLKGRFFWNKLTPEGLQKSLDFYSQAIEIDPNYALAYAGLADSFNLLGSYGIWPLKESHPKARSAAEKALELDGDLAEAHASLATVIADYYWDWAAADKHFKLAIDLNPNYPVARYWHSQHLSRMGRLEEAVEEARRAQTLDPLSSSANSHVGLALYRARHFDEAAAELRKTLEFDPQALDAHIFLGFVYVQQGKGREAIAEFQTVVTLSERNPSMVALLGYGYAATGMRDEAEAILKEFDAQSKKQPVYHIETAMIYIALGEHDRAFERLEKAYDERAWQLGFLKVEPIFDPLRSDPRFAELLKRVGLP